MSPAAKVVLFVIVLGCFAAPKIGVWVLSIFFGGVLLIALLNRIYRFFTE